LGTSPALTLLDQDTDLDAMTVEGVRARESGNSSESWEGVDCALYFKGDTLESAGRVDLVWPENWICMKMRYFAAAASMANVGFAFSSSARLISFLLVFFFIAGLLLHP
jgi:hypothetical protein